MIRELNWYNGKDCGSGFDVYLYIDDETGAAAAMIKRLSDRRAVYVDLTGTEDAERVCFHYANGANHPLESEDGAEQVWDDLNEEFKQQDSSWRSPIQS